MRTGACVQRGLHGRVPGRLPGRVPARLRGAALWLAALACLVGQGSSLAHLILIRHTTCAEHDALVHTSAPAAGGQVAPRGAAASAVPAEEAAHEDEHCLVASCRRIDLADQAVALAAPATLSYAEASSAVWRRPPPASPVPLLRLAPKSSPPALTV
jgi:hypothetical protein